jgi:hypothetical protein
LFDIDGWRQSADARMRTNHIVIATPFLERDACLSE